MKTNSILFGRLNSFNLKLSRKHSFLNFLIIGFLIQVSSYSLKAQCNCSSSWRPPQTISGISFTQGVVSGSVSNYPSPFTSCGTYTTSGNSIWLGQAGTFSYTLNASSPISSICLILTATGQPFNENFILNTNVGLPQIEIQSACFSSVVDNQIFSGSGADAANGGGGGIFRVFSSTPFTSLTISGTGGMSGSLIQFCTPIPCNAGTTAPTFSATTITNSCSSQTVNLNTLHSGTIPSGSSLVWSTDNTSANGLSMVGNAEDGNGDGRVDDPTTVEVSGTYYAYYLDAVNNCYSPVSVGVLYNAVQVPVIEIGTVVNPSTCISTDGSIQITGSGTGVLNWSGATSGSLSSVTLPYTVTGLSQGGYNFQFISSCASNVLTRAIWAPNLPTPTITTSGSTTICSGNSVVLTSSSGSGYTFQWNLNGTPIVGGIASSYTASVAGNYTVKVTSGGCTATSTQTIVTLVNSIAPTLSATTITNACPSQMVNLNALHTGTIPSGSSLVWSTDITSSGGLSMAGNSEDGNGDGRVDDPTTVEVPSTYYAYYYDHVNTCYSPVSVGLMFAVTPCCNPLAPLITY